ncbi:MAG: 4-hydroxybenzoate octaprenyltransferase [Pseudomonadota bacterium]
MQTNSQTSGDASRGHTDISRKSWIERVSPAGFGPYIRLARLDRPIGTWLLLLPCWWTLILAAPQLGLEPLWYAVLFALGALVMRGAGCTINDIIDRDLDAKVERTKGRPLPSGEVRLSQAITFTIAQCLVGLAVLLQFNLETIVIGIMSLALVVTYPLMKRITWWPQLFLGLTFNWGVFVGWVSIEGAIAWPIFTIYLGGIFWTLGYDTIYAHQDLADDEQVGVKSSARYLGSSNRPVIASFYAGAWISWLMGLIFLTGVPLIAMVAMVPVGLHFAWQMNRWDDDDPASALMIFRSNRETGFLVLLSFAFAMNMAAFVSS